MNSPEKWFPVLFTLPFLFATTMLEALRMPSELGRWLVLAAALGLAIYHGMARGPGGRVGITGADLFCLLFLVFFGISSQWAIDPSYSLQRSISFGLLYIATCWYGWGYADRWGDRQLLRMLLGTGAVILGLNLFIFGAMDPGSILGRRFQGFFENPNNIGLICSVSVPLVFAEYLRKRSMTEAVGFGVFFLSLLACGSRTGLISSLVGMALIGGTQALRGNLLAIRFGMGMVVLIVVAVLTNFLEDNVARMESLETLSDRTFFWDLAKTDYIPKRPWLGHGFGTDGLIHEFYGITLSDLKLRGYGVMSSYYGLAVAVGIPAAILFYLGLAASLVVPLKNYWKDPQLVALCGMVIAGLLVGITESAIYSVGNCFAYFYWMGFMLMIRRTTYRKSGVPMTPDGALPRRLNASERKMQEPKRRSGPVSRPLPPHPSEEADRAAPANPEC